ncbi:Crp/Fnr family transcriptional regulator [Algoriphagus litoralis]|uniref:Crp/Fnr family transcriptional regulator n=1 Tax=Algoriphagus litoralis TaxID=2202829 RepID=UPI000DBAAF02|nr:Crp/Fnr family transcriptional regulator [Algoriphagus litoralis]
MEHALRRHLEELISLSNTEFELIASCFTSRRIKKKEFLFRQGDRVSEMYFIVSGLLKLIYTDESGKERILSFAMEDWWESDYEAFERGGPAKMSLQSLENCQILILSKENFTKLCNEIPKMAQFFLHKAIAGHIAAQQRVLSLMNDSASDRFDQLIQRQPSLIHRISKSTLASYLGVSRETLSRLSR